MVPTAEGVYCPGGDFWIDPWRPVPRAVITHAHSDHAIFGCARYLTARDGKALLAERLGPDAVIDALTYGATQRIEEVELSLHPAGHILGSAQVRIVRAGRVAVFTGDFKTAADPTCAPFDPLPCHTFATETTFALPVYRWPAPATVMSELHAWWAANQAEGRTSVVYGYALGKSQRLLASLDPSAGPIFAHGAVRRYLAAYAAAGVALPEVRPADTADVKAARGAGIVIAPPSAHNTPWYRKLGPTSAAFASGWMRLRGMRRRRVVDRGFVLSDHADFPALLETIRATGAEKVLAMHGYTDVFTKYLREQGWDASVLETHHEGDEGGDHERLPDAPVADNHVSDDASLLP